MQMLVLRKKGRSIKMGYINEDLYSCDSCGFEEAWDATDDIHGDLWECEVCGYTYCSLCFFRELGEATFYKMCREEDYVLCPACYKKEHPCLDAQRSPIALLLEKIPLSNKTIERGNS